MTGEGRAGPGKFIKSSFAVTSSTSSTEFIKDQRCYVMPSASRTARKRLNKKSFFQALKRECIAVFQDSTGEIPRSTSTTPISTSTTRSTSTTPISTSTTRFSTSTTKSTSTTQDVVAGKFETEVKGSSRREAERYARLEMEKLAAAVQQKYGSQRQADSTSSSYLSTSTSRDINRRSSSTTVNGSRILTIFTHNKRLLQNALAPKTSKEDIQNHQKVVKTRMEAIENQIESNSTLQTIRNFCDSSYLERFKIATYLTQNSSIYQRR